MIFKIRIAQKIIEIHSLYQMVYTHCIDYITNEAKTDIIVHITSDDILFERQKTIKEQFFGNETTIDFSDEYLEITAVYRKIIIALRGHNVVLMHGSVVAVGDSAYLFTAPSGIGKTTHTKLWLKNISGSYVVNGDKPLLIIGDEIYACGTPWCGKEKMHTNKNVPLKAIVILERSLNNEICKITLQEAFSTLLGQTYRASDRDGMLETVEQINMISKKLKLYRLKCNMQDEAATMAYEFIK